MTAIAQSDISFSADDGAELLATLYRPAVEEPFPLLVDVHGGAWVNGDRFNNAPIHKRLVEAGIGVFALDFRMPPVVRYPRTVQDVNAGLRWLLAHCSRCGTLPCLVGGLGTSSGAHLLLLNALLPTDPRWTAAVGEGVKLGFAVLCWPILDPLARYRMARVRKLKNLVEAHERFWADEDEMAQGNPHLMLERREHVHTPELLVLQGTADQNVEPERVTQFAALYRAAGGSVDVRTYEGEPHAFALDRPDSSASLEAIDELIGFVRLKTGRS